MPRLEIDIAARLAQFQDGLTAITKNSETAAKKIDAAFGVVRQSLSALGVGLSASAFIGTVRGAINLGDELNKLSQKVGVSVETLSSLKFAAELSDVSIESFTKGMRAFNLSLVEAQNPATKIAAIFGALGVDIKAGPHAALLQFSDAVKQLGDGETKTALATEVLKKAGVDWIPLLNQGRQGIEAAEESARKLGITIGPDFAAKAEAFNDNLKKLETSSSRLGIAIARGTLEPLTEISDRLTRAAESGNKLKGAFIELNRIVAAALGSLGQTLGIDRLDKFAEDYFKQTERLGTAVSGKIRGAPANQPPPEPAKPDQNRLKDILAHFENPEQLRDARERLLDSIAKAGVDAEREGGR